MFELRLACAESAVESISDALEALDALSVSAEDADADTRHRALAWAAQFGRTDVVRLLLDAGEDPNRYNPVGCHAHSTPLHQAVLAGHEDVVKLLVDRGADRTKRDAVYDATPHRWAEHAGHDHLARLLEP